jgi:hypothetical protein
MSPRLLKMNGLTNMLGLRYVYQLILTVSLSIFLLFLSYPFRGMRLERQ